MGSLWGIICRGYLNYTREELQNVNVLYGNQATGLTRAFR